MLGLGGRREVIGLQVALAGTEDPEEKPEVCHLTGGGPSLIEYPLYNILINELLSLTLASHQKRFISFSSID